MVATKIALKALERLPKNLVSRAFGVISEVELPRPVQGVVNQGFARLAGIDQREAEAPPGDYSSLNAYFTRRLRPEARPVQAGGPGDLVSPVDGKVGAFGKIEAGTLVQAKGRHYSLVDLVDSAEEAAAFEGGAFLTIYLSPRDYHRIHSPVTGPVEKVSYIPGHLFPVNGFAVKNIDELFAVNERLITYLNSKVLGRLAVIKVGATCVGKITLSFDSFVTNRAFRVREEIPLSQPPELAAGDELASFNLGSTVILLMQGDRGFSFADHLSSGLVVRVGEVLGTATV